jgi:hypothetical protein
MEIMCDNDSIGARRRQTDPVMETSSAPAPTARNPAASVQATLGELVAIARKYLDEQMMALASRIVAELLDVPAGSDPQLVSRRLKSGNLLKNNAYAFLHLASKQLEPALRREIDQLVPNAKPKAGAMVELALVPMDEMDTRIAFGALSRPFDIAVSEPLAQLGVRLGLLLGRELVRAAHNPFRPEVFLVGIHQTWCEFEPDREAHDLILPLLRPGIVFDLVPLLDALNEHLKSRAGAARNIQKTLDAAAARAARARGDAALAQQLRRFLGAESGGIEAGLIPDLPNMPQGQGGWRPSGASGFVCAPDGASSTAGAPAPGSGASHPGATARASGDPARAGTVPPTLQVAAGSAASPPAHGAVPGAAGSATAWAPVPLLERLEQLPSRHLPGPAPSAGSVPHNVFYLPRLKQSLPKGSLSRGDENTLDLLSRIFETILIDDSIAPETRELIEFLQVPVLKAALRDQAFFFEDAHPARRMLDLLSGLGWEQRRAADDPLVQSMRRSVGTLGDVHADPARFADAVAELEARIAEEERAVEAAIAGTIAKALKQEKQAAAARSAREAIAVRLGDSEVLALVGAFLENRWHTVLTLAYTIEDDRPGAVRNATRVMDELIWSVKPKATQEERKALLGRLPSLLGALNKWLDLIQWQDAERLQFFARLAECHAAIVRAPIDLSPERQLELAVEAAQQDALRRIALEQAAVAAGSEAPVDEAHDRLAALERGMRLEFSDAAGGVRKVRLAWVSPLRTLFIFSGAGRQEAFSLPAEKLAQALHAGSARVVALEGVVGRVLQDAMRDAAVNDPSPAAMLG